MSKFKVGDRVRRVKHSPWPEHYGEEGAEYTVNGFDAYGNIVVTGDGYGADESAFELVEPAAVAPATADLTVEAGKFYKTRDGRKMKANANPNDTQYPFYLTDERGNGRHGITAGGVSCIDDDTFDLISEWVDEPVAVAAQFKVGDRVKFVGGGLFTSTSFTIGKEYTVRYYEEGYDRFGVVEDDEGNENGWKTSYFEPVDTTAPPALPTIGDWVRADEGRIGVVFHNDGCEYGNLKVGYTEDGSYGWYSADDLTIVPPGTKQAEPEPAPANDNYEVGDIVEIVDTGIFGFSVSVGDIAAVTDTDGDISIRVQTKYGPVDQVVFLENASHIRPYRRTA